MSDTQPTSEERNTRGFPVSAEVFAGVVADRIAGMEYPDIAAKHGIHHGTARRIAKRAIKSGLVTAEQIAYRPLDTSRALDKSAYDAKWLARVKSKCIVDGNGCWLWQGFLSAKGYGLTAYRNSNPSVHRMMFQVVHGISLRTQQFVCHRCDVRRCCNPEHLVLADNDWNMADKCAKGRHHEMKVTHCPRGHAYDDANTEIKPNGSRSCRTCCRARQRIKSGWSEEDAYSIPPIPQNAKTPRRWAGRKAA